MTPKDPRGASSANGTVNGGPGPRELIITGEHLQEQHQLLPH